MFFDNKWTASKMKDFRFGMGTIAVWVYLHKTHDWLKLFQGEAMCMYKELRD